MIATKLIQIKIIKTLSLDMNINILKKLGQE